MCKLWVKCFGGEERMVTGKKRLKFHSHVLLPVFDSKLPNGVKKASMAAIL